jgi:hypothetical protein
MDAFRTMFGEPPVSCRFGDRWLSEMAVTLERDRGIKYDLTVEPGLPGGRVHDDPHSRGGLPDFRSAPREPWVPSRGDYLRPDTADAGLWMIPLTTTMPALRPVRRAPYIMLASRSPNLSLSTSYMWPHLKKQLDRPSDSPLVMVFRSGDLVHARFNENFSRTTRLLVRHPGLSYCEFVEPAEAVDRWLARSTA